MHLPANAPLTQWLHYIEDLHPSEIDLGLTRLQRVAQRLLAAARIPFVYSVAGTNGKGTTSAALAALSQAAGLRVGCYSSPHIQRFNERININGQAVADQELTAAFAQVEAARGDVSLSYFEYTTLAALLVFTHHALDVWVLEVGLGGRLDAVNIIDADVAVITSIGLDHQDFLGSDLAGIGREKAGIARAGRPLVLGKGADNNGVLVQAEHCGAPLYRYSSSHGATAAELYWHNGSVALPAISIPHSNAACALQAFALGPGQLTTEQLAQVLQRVELPGRMQRLTYGDADLIADVGHNPQAAEYLCTQLCGRSFHLVLGMLMNKDARGFIAALQPLCKTLSLVSLDVPRGHKAASLATAAGVGNAHCYACVPQAITAIAQQHPGEDLFVGGSFYTVQAAFDFLGYSVGA